MSMLLSNASRLKPEIRLAQAVSQFEADLSDEQKTIYRTLKSQSLNSHPGPSDVMRLTADIDRRMSREAGGRCWAPFYKFPAGGPAVRCAWGCCGWRLTEHNRMQRLVASAHVVAC